MFLLLKEKGRKLFFLMAILKWPRRRAKASDSLKKRENLQTVYTRKQKDLSDKKPFPGESFLLRLLLDLIRLQSRE